MSSVVKATLPASVHSCTGSATRVSIQALLMARLLLLTTTHVHVSSKFRPQLLSLCFPQPSRKLSPRWYSQVLHPIRRIPTLAPIPLPKRPRQLPKRHRIPKLFPISRRRMQRTRRIRQVLQLILPWSHLRRIVQARKVVLHTQSNQKNTTTSSQALTCAYPSGVHSPFFREGEFGLEFHPSPLFSNVPSSQRPPISKSPW